MFFLQLSLGSLDGIILLLIILSFIPWVIYLVAIANGNFYDSTTKLCWFFIVLFLYVFGVFLFLIWGRKEVDYRIDKNKKSGIPFI
jgi:hypothetical protein